MSRNIKKARITRISKVKADRSLEERVTALEKQLTDMQAAMSCELQNILLTMQANQQFGCDVEKSISELSHKKI
ncbi:MULTISPECIES: hypothetical protein [unclassified Providencia]|uniref:hypothetical protein n=1 Tax=unclassified Providencia TaxID=2633465 RepID=UPI0023498903|nr:MULTISPECIES: hypothetical protein [unclassified Providencia]